MNIFKSPINYAGSKEKVLNQIKYLIPTNDVCNTFVDLFCGSGTMYMNLMNEYDKIIANDYNKEIIKIHENIFDLDFLRKAIRTSKETKNDQEKYIQIRQRYNETKETYLLLALIWSCNSGMARFNKKEEFNQTWGKRCFNKGTKDRLERLLTIKNKDINLSSLDFEDVDYKKESFVYLDPPYSNTSAGYNLQWTIDDDKRIIRLLDNLIDENIYFGISGTVNENENIIYDFLKDKDVKIHYFGDVFKNSKINKDKNNEYYITNYEK